MISQYKVEFENGMRVVATHTRGAKKALITWLTTYWYQGEEMKWMSHEYWPIKAGQTVEDFLRENVRDEPGRKWGPVVGLPGKR